MVSKEGRMPRKARVTTVDTVERCREREREREREIEREHFG